MAEAVARGGRPIGNRTRIAVAAQRIPALVHEVVARAEQCDRSTQAVVLAPGLINGRGPREVGGHG